MGIRFLNWKDSLEKEMAIHLEYSCQENSIDRGALWATVCEVPKSWTQLTSEHSLTHSLMQNILLI